jgi:hypothetical protein
MGRRRKRPHPGPLEELCRLLQVAFRQEEDRLLPRHHHPYRSLCAPEPHHDLGTPLHIPTMAGQDEAVERRGHGREGLDVGHAGGRAQEWDGTIVRSYSTRLQLPGWALRAGAVPRLCHPAPDWGIVTSASLTGTGRDGMSTPGRRCDLRARAPTFSSTRSTP